MAELSSWMSDIIETCRLENEVLRMKMALMARDYEAEKYEIIKAKDKIIKEQKTITEELNIKIGDKVYQMDKASFGKDKKINSLKKLAGKLSEQNIKLKIDLKQWKERYEQSSVKHARQDERFKKLESELSEVTNELTFIRIAKKEQESLFATYLKDTDEKYEIREKQLRKMMQKQHAEMLCQITSSGKESKLSISDVHNVQISLDSSNGRNDAAFITKTTNSQTTGNINLPK